MSATIIEMATGYSDAIGGYYKAVELSNTELTRQLSIGTNWTRLGIAWQTDVGGSLTSGVPLLTPGFCVGVCSGGKGPMQGEDCDHFFGYNVGGAGGLSITVETGNTTQGYETYTNANARRVMQYEGGVETLSSYSLGTNSAKATLGGCHPDALTTGFRSMGGVIGISKNGSTWSVGDVTGGTSYYGGTSQPKDQMDFILRARSIANVGTMADTYLGIYRYIYSPGGSATVDEATYGDLDHLCFSWPNLSPTLRLWSLKFAVWE